MLHIEYDNKKFFVQYNTVEGEIYINSMAEMCNIGVDVFDDYVDEYDEIVEVILQTQEDEYYYG